MAAAAGGVGAEARAPMLKDAEEGTHPLVLADRATIALSFLFWLSVDFLGIYAIIVETHVDGKFDWHLLHTIAVGVLLVVVSLLGVYWEIRSLQVGYLTVSEDLINFLIYIVAGCYMAAGPWSITGDSESEAATAYGRFLTVLGIILGTARVTIGCMKRQQPQQPAPGTAPTQGTTPGTSFQNTQARRAASGPVNVD